MNCSQRLTRPVAILAIISGLSSLLACALPAAHATPESEVELPPNRAAGPGELGWSQTSPNAAPDAASPTIEIDGRLVLSPTDGRRAVRIVGANGVATDVMSDPTGRFRASGIAAPYDLRIDTSAWLGKNPILYLGLTSATPVVRLAVGQGEPVSNHVFETTIPVPSCDASCCFAWLVTESAHGTSSARFVYAPGETSVDGQIAHVFHAAAPEPMTLHVLLHDANFSWYRYAVWKTDARPGAKTQIGSLLPIQVPTTDVLRAEVIAAGVPRQWDRRLAVNLTLVGGGSVRLAAVDADVVGVRAPVLPGASVSAGAVLWQFNDETEFSQRTWAWSGEQPISTTTLSLAPEMPPALQPDGLHPGGAISLATLGFAWTTTGPALSEWTVRGDEGFTARTNANAISFAQLSRLGLQLRPGPIRVQLATEAGIDLTAAMREDVAILALGEARRGALTGSAGNLTEQRFVLQLVE